MIGKMPGTYEEKFANLRAFYGYMASHPGKKLLFMGSEFAQFIEWDFKKELDWFLLDYPAHRAMQTYVRDLNKFYLDNKAFYDNETGWEGFSWISADDKDNSVIAFRRIAKDSSEIICVLNFCPVKRTNYLIGVPQGKYLVPVFSSDRKKYGGEGTPLRRVSVKERPMHGYDHSAALTLPPMSATFYKCVN